MGIRTDSGVTPALKEDIEHRFNAARLGRTTDAHGVPHPHIAYAMDYAEKHGLDRETALMLVALTQDAVIRHQHEQLVRIVAERDLPSDIANLLAQARGEVAS